MTRQGAAPAGGMPRWVKAFLAIGVLLLVVIVAAVLSGHGPGRHVGHGPVAAAVSGGRA